MTPMPQPFDIKLAIARLDTESTVYLRDRYPTLGWVWDELDELRAMADDAVDPDDMTAVEKELDEALDERDTAREAARRALSILDSTGDVEQAAAALSEIAEAFDRQTLPQRRPNVTVDATWNGHPITVTVGYDMTGAPREVFANTSRGGDMLATLADACVLVSIALQHGIPHEALAKSLGRMPDLRGGNIPASPVGAILEIVGSLAPPV